MPDPDICPECSVPELLNQQLMWLDSGVIVQKRDQTHRMTFIECENLDPLFQGIEDIINVPIDRLIIAAKYRATCDYISKLIGEEVKGMLKRGEISINPLLDLSMTTGRVFGLGNITNLEVRIEQKDDDLYHQHVSEPYSLPLYLGDVTGTIEGLTESEWGFECKEMSPGVYDISLTYSAHPPEFKRRLLRKEYHHREGDIKFAACNTCGGPAALSGFKWHLDRGIILSQSTGRRMAFTGETGLEATFHELEVELGDTIPRTVVEAQKRFVKTGFYSMQDIGNEGDLRTQLGLRGLGNLKEMKLEKKGTRVCLESSTLHLLIVGLFQGLYEVNFGIDSNVEWELSEEGELELEVTPRG